MDDLMEGAANTSYSDLCKICLRSASRYVCPRCNTPYCSLDCYQSEVHSDCSESFYHEWVENELKSSRVSADGHRRMADILNRMKDGEEEENLDSDDEGSLPDLADRLSGVDLNDANTVWEKLSVTERAAFKELITTGTVADIIPSWEPWWSNKFEVPKVVQLDKSMSHNYDDSYKANCPPVYKKIKPLREICKIKISDSVIFDLVNILGGYALTMRYFNGECSDFAEEVMAIICNISRSLKTAQKFTSHEMALEDVGLQALIFNGLEISAKEIDTMKEDVACILNGPSSKDRSYYILAALSDMHKLFSDKKKKKEVTNDKFSQMFPDGKLEIPFLDRQTSVACAKRIQFFQSWVYSSDFNKLKLFCHLNLEFQ